MKHMSIRMRILAGVVLVNLLGSVVTMVYLHQSYSGGVETSAATTVALGAAAYEQLTAGEAVDPVADAKGADALVGRMKAITGADYGFLFDKAATSPETYSEAREAAGLGNNWDEGGETYVVAASTDEAASARMKFEATPDGVPEIGKTVGVENGACSRTCHNGITAEGEYWGVAWSTDSKSRAHAVFPVSNEAGKPIGVIYAVDDITVQADAAKSSMMRTLLVIGSTLLVATLLIGGMIDGLVFKRLNRMMLSIEDVSMRVAGGDFDARFVPDGSTDEIGQFESFFANVLDLMTGTIKSLMRSK